MGGGEGMGFGGDDSRACEPDRFPMQGCAVLAGLMACLLIGLAGGVWAWAETTWSLTR